MCHCHAGWITGDMWFSRPGGEDCWVCTSETKEDRDFCPAHQEKTQTLFGTSMPKMLVTIIDIFILGSDHSSPSALKGSYFFFFFADRAHVRPRPWNLQSRVLHWSNGRFKGEVWHKRYKTCRLLPAVSWRSGHECIPSLAPQITTELFFLVAKFLEASPCQEAAKVDFSELARQP